MSWIPLLNTEPHTFTTEDLPALIHGEKGSGASLFSITLLAQFFQQGEPILFLSASDKAKNDFLSQIHDEKECMSVTNESELALAGDKQVIHLSVEHESLLPLLWESLEDKAHRVVLLKNIEVFSDETISSLYTHPLTIFSGDLNTSTNKESLLQLKYNAKIFFSPLHNDLRLTLPELEQYHGYYQGRTNQGTVNLAQTP